MEKRVFEVSKKRVWINIALFSFIIISSLGYLFFVSHEKRITDVLSKVIILMVCLIFLSARNLFSKNKAILTLDAEGLIFQGNKIGCKVGKIVWEDIEEIYTGKVYFNSFLFIRFSNPEKYTWNITGLECDNIIKNGFSIPSSQLKMSFKEMEKVICIYYEKYKSNRGLEIND